MAQTAAKRRQITVPIANQPGTLAGVTGALRAAQINIEAFTVFEGQAHLLVDQPARAAEALREARYSCLESDVLVIDLPHAPGELAAAAGALSEAGINIDYAYSGPASETGRARVALAVSDLARALQLV
jgi:hypothetical protein